MIPAVHIESCTQWIVSVDVREALVERAREPAEDAKRIDVLRGAIPLLWIGIFCGVMIVALCFWKRTNDGFDYVLGVYGAYWAASAVHVHRRVCAALNGMRE